VRVQGCVMSSCPFPEYRADVRDVKVGMEGLIGDIPWCVCYSSEKFGLISLEDSYVGLSSTSPYGYKNKVTLWKTGLATSYVRNAY
jgi:hypothetical protein